MTADSPVDSRKDGIVTAICVLVFLVSTATGSAYVMFIVSIVTLALMTLFYRERLGRMPLLALGVAAVAAFFAAYAVMKW